MAANRHLTAQMEALWTLIDGNQVLSTALDGAARIMPPDWYLGAGCIAQTVWNRLSGRDPMAEINDLDLVYFDGTDLSEEAEDLVIQRVRRELGHLPVKIDVKNQGRVHLWYERRFGYPIRPYTSLEDAINTWPTTATSVGVRRTGGEPVVYAPFGLNDLFSMIVRPNKRQITREVYEAKVRRWTACWPALQVVPW